MAVVNFGPILALLGFCFGWCHALPGGAPSLACYSMTPYHFTFQAQPLEESPFTVRQSKLAFVPGNDTVTVALTATKGRTFKGFLVKAFNPVTNRTIGKFRSGFATASRDNCNAATHVDPEEKTFANLHWTSEDVYEDENYVVFEATFVETFKKFYVGVESVYNGIPARQEVETLRAQHSNDKNFGGDKASGGDKSSSHARKNPFWF